MKLADWMQKSSTDIYQLSKELECSIYAARKWLRGERTPRPMMQARIKRLTKGSVGGDDWLPIENPN